MFYCKGVLLMSGRIAAEREQEMCSDSILKIFQDLKVGNRS